MECPLLRGQNMPTSFKMTPIFDKSG